MARVRLFNCDNIKRHALKSTRQPYSSRQKLYCRHYLHKNWHLTATSKAFKDHDTLTVNRKHLNLFTKRSPSIRDVVMHFGTLLRTTKGELHRKGGWDSMVALLLLFGGIKRRSCVYKAIIYVSSITIVTVKSPCHVDFTLQSSPNWQLNRECMAGGWWWRF